MGVVVSFLHTPCRSGSPHGVRRPPVVVEGGAFFAAAGAWPATRPAESDTSATATAAPRYRYFISISFTSFRLDRRRRTERRYRSSRGTACGRRQTSRHGHWRD